MTLPIEIMLRGNERVFTESLEYPVEPAAWTEADVAEILKGILRAINRAQNPGAVEEPPVALRGMNWIVHPSAQGPVIALEIHSASAVAGPVDLPEATLDGLIGRAVSAATRRGTVH
ncbi:MAG TPA: hypothetical protein VIL35_03175 [Vicinamibacterales bacterium]